MKVLKFLGISLLSLLFCNNSALAQTDVIDEVVAVVGKNMIKLSELETGYLQMKSRSGIIENQFGAKCEILEGMLINKLMLHQAALDSIQVTEDEINREMDSRLKYMIMKYGSKENLEKQMNRSLGEIKEYYRDVIKENLLISNIENKLTGNIKITPKEVTDYYHSIQKDSLPTVEEEYEFIQIVKLPVVSQEEKVIVKEKLNGYRERILKGDRFSTLAQLYSEDPGSARKGGELGFFSRGDMVAEFEATAFSLQPGEISAVFETKYGFHIVQLIERRGDQVNCRHILIQPKVSDIEVMRAKRHLDSIKTAIADGKISFEEAIKTHSDDPTKLTGGIIINPYTSGARFQKEEINDLMGNIEKINFELMKEGEMTNPVLFKAESGSAYRLIRVNAKIPAHKVNLKDDYDKVHSSALESLKTKAVMDWANKTVKKTYIKMNSDYKECDFKINWKRD